MTCGSRHKRGRDNNLTDGFLEAHKGGTTPSSSIIRVSFLRGRGFNSSPGRRAVIPVRWLFSALPPPSAASGGAAAPRCVEEERRRRMLTEAAGLNGDDKMPSRSEKERQ